MWSKLLTASVVATIPTIALAQSNSTELDACRTTSLIALQERSPTVRDVVFDVESLAISKSNTKVEDTPIQMVIMGEAWLERKQSGNPRRFVCLIGEKGKVLLTFFTAQ